jgi:type II secretory pathway component PulF
MLEIGVRGNDLPGVLTLLADHYHRTAALWNRLKGLLVYPFIVIGVSLALTTLLSFVFGQLVRELFEPTTFPVLLSLMNVWVPPVLLGLAALLGGAAVAWPRSRAWLRWRLPAFRDASLAQLASAIALMLKQGTPLPDALALSAAIESNSPAGKALGDWRRLIESGQGKPTQWPQSIPPFPPLFLWLVQEGGEDLHAGFSKAAEIYQARATFRIELALYGALPVSILLLGQMVLWQVAPLVHALVQVMNNLGG